MSSLACIYEDLTNSTQYLGSNLQTDMMFPILEIKRYIKLVAQINRELLSV